MTLDELAAAIVAVEPDDLPELGRIHSAFKDLTASEKPPQQARDLAARGMAEIEKVILRESADPTAAITLAGELVSAVQAACDAAADGRPMPVAPMPCTPASRATSENAKPADGGTAKASQAIEADRELLYDFVTESMEHLEKAEGALLDIEANPEDTETVNGIFRAFHTIKGTSGFLALESVNKLAHKAETLLDRARQGEIKLAGGAADVALDVVDALKVLVGNVRRRLEGQGEEDAGDIEALMGRLDSPEVEESSPERLRVGDILVAKGRAGREEVEKVAAQATGAPIGTKLVQAGVATTKEVVDALRTQRQMGGTAEAGSDATLRVSMKRLDRLIDMVGELVIAHSMVVQDSAVKGSSSHVLSRNVGQVGKITRELHDLTLSMRMVPLKSAFQKMERLVRDLARKSGKDVRFVTVGEDTEIDRNMVDALSDPLVHMMRNSVDHGIEGPEAREGAGKPRQGTVTLKAYHAAGSVVIEIADDGKGIDAERVLAKAVEKGLVEQKRELSEAEIQELIFLPGFSTAEKVTDVSGRGVGMDVVRRNVEGLRGRVEMRSEKGKGSRFTIKLPLTLAIIDGMLLKVGRESYILPTLAIKHAMKPERKGLSTVVGKGEMVNLRGELMPVFRLHALFGVPGAVEDATAALLVVVEHEGQRCALLADALLGQQQVVIKSVGEALGATEGVSGAAILGDGKVGLILDVAGIMRIAHESEGKAEPAHSAA